MKKCMLIISLVLSSGTLFAALNLVSESAVYVSVNGGSSQLYNCSAAYPFGYNFDGEDLSTVNSITLGAECRSWDTSGDEAKLGYKIDDGDAHYIDMPYLESADNNDKWQNPGPCEINFEGLSAGDHTLAVWFLVTDTDADITAYDDKSGNNYVASFHLDSDVPLPISLTSFTAEAINGTVHVSWITESETENSHFLLYRDDEVIATLEGAGTTSESRQYRYADRSVVPGKTYTYVLADVSIANEEVKHEDMPVTVNIPQGNVAEDYSIGTAYPNPFNPVTIIPLNLAKKAAVTATLYDINGRPLQELQNGTLSTGSHYLKIRGAGLSTGIYVVHVTIDDVTNVQKVVLMK